MTKISDLSRDLAEEVLSRIPVTSLRAVRFTCKKWNSLTKHKSFTKKQIVRTQLEAKKKQDEEFQAIITMDYSVYLMSVNLDAIHKDDNVESSIKQKGKLISLNGARIGIDEVYHCDGLLLCTTYDNSRLVVWNPYSGQTRLIEPRNSYHKRDKYALGYEKNNKAHGSYKILRYLDAYDERDMRTGQRTRICEFEIYNFDSNSWKVIEVTPDWDLPFFQRCVFLKGNTYWFAQEHRPPYEGEDIPHGEQDEEEEIVPSFLVCFDFTTERFGPCLPLPFNSCNEDTITLSNVREEQLAVLQQRWYAASTRIWITSKIEPNAVSWSDLFFPLGGMRQLQPFSASFFFDEEKKVAVVFDKGKYFHYPTRNVAYIVGENKYRKQVDLGESAHRDCYPLACSYVPSSVQI